MTPEQYRGTVEKYDREESKKNDEKRKQKEKGVDKESEMMEEEHGNVGDNKMKKMKPVFQDFLLLKISKRSA